MSNLQMLVRASCTALYGTSIVVLGFVCMAALFDHAIAWNLPPLVGLVLVLRFVWAGRSETPRS